MKILFGLEVCYFKNFEGLTAELTKDRGFDFLLGSVHFAGDFAFDHTAELWEGEDVDEVFRNYYEDEIRLAKSGLFDGIVGICALTDKRLVLDFERQVLRITV